MKIVIQGMKIVIQGMKIVIQGMKLKKKYVVVQNISPRL